MSRCYCCNCILTPQESTRKFVVSGDYTDMCTKCLNTIDASYDEGASLDDAEEDEEE